MPPPFQDLDPKASPPDFERLLARFPFERRISCLHVHRWPLREEEWRGHRSLKSIWYSQTRQLGWSDIAQHLTIGPDGCIWTGRDWNRPPCSTRDGNGNCKEGPFMISLVGDLERMREDCRANQCMQLVNVIARALRHFQLSPVAIKYHGELQAEGHSSAAVATNFQSLTDKIEARYRELEANDTPVRASPVSELKQPFGEEAELWYQFITISNHYRRKLPDDPVDAHGVTGI